MLRKFCVLYEIHSLSFCLISKSLKSFQHTFSCACGDSGDSGDDVCVFGGRFNPLLTSRKRFANIFYFKCEAFGKHLLLFLALFHFEMEKELLEKRYFILIIYIFVYMDFCISGKSKEKKKILPPAHDFQIFYSLEMHRYRKSFFMCIAVILYTGCPKNG